MKRSAIDGTGPCTGAFIRRRARGELTGESISIREARKLATQGGRLALVELANGWAIDAGDTASEFRYIDHSCAPDTHMRRIGDRYEFYALRDIERGRGLTYDYGPTHHEGALRFLCGADARHGFIEFVRPPDMVAARHRAASSGRLLVLS